ncbi:MAG: SCO family protein [Acidobacteriota bacterium]
MKRMFIISILVLIAAGFEKPAAQDFSLTDHNGHRFRLSEHRGKAILLFFGYTSCAEACPVILSRVNKVFERLGSDGEKAMAVFISVDPERDTEHVLRDYVRYFSARTVALTGSREEIDAVVEQFGAQYEIEKTDSALGYHVNHTTDIYLIDRRGAVHSRFRHTDRADLIADAVKSLIR